MLEESNENSDKVQDVPANSTVKQNSDISLLDNYPPSSTDVHSNDPKHPVSDHSKEDEDDEVQIATQMAAVVLAASTKGTVSPSAEANFAKDISATISNLPPTNVLKRKKKRMPVHVNLVQEIISKRIKEQMKAHGNALTTIPCDFRVRENSANSFSSVNRSMLCRSSHSHVPLPTYRVLRSNTIKISCL
jgi:hypothetical protein